MNALLAFADATSNGPLLGPAAQPAAIVCFAIGCFLILTGAVGLIRMPDFYSRLHPAGKSDTLAQFFLLLGLVCLAEDPMVQLKLAILTGLLFVTAPTATHAISRAAELDGLKPWTKHAPAEGARGDGTEVADG